MSRSPEGTIVYPTRHNLHGTLSTCTAPFVVDLELAAAKVERSTSEALIFSVAVHDVVGKAGVARCRSGHATLCLCMRRIHWVNRVDRRFAALRPVAEVARLERTRLEGWDLGRKLVAQSGSR